MPTLWLVMLLIHNKLLDTLETQLNPNYCH